MEQQIFLFCSVPNSGLFCSFMLPVTECSMEPQMCLFCSVPDGWLSCSVLVWWVVLLCFVLFCCSVLLPVTRCSMRPVYLVATSCMEHVNDVFNTSKRHILCETLSSAAKKKGCCSADLQVPWNRMEQNRKEPLTVVQDLYC